jgi:murein DD-endopeptidase MepM/ murein hydrolase activator NlpD
MKRSPSSFLVALLLLGGSAAARDVTGPMPDAPLPAGADRLSATQASLARVPRAASDLEKLVLDLERERHGLEQRFEVLGKQAQTSGARALARGRAYLRLIRAGLLPVGGGFGALVEHAARLERLRHGLAADLLEQKSAVSERVRLSRRLEELKARLGPLEVERDALARAESMLLSAEDRERAFQRAFDNAGEGDHTAVYGAVGPSDPRDVLSGFSAMRGRLPFPITGRAEIKSARRSSSEGPGLEMRAPLGTPVRAVFPGRVAFADMYADYGKTVIVDHGGRSYTVSANLGQIDVNVGDEVSANTRLGSVGDAGRGALVYFEIRLGAGTVDPAEWFGI